MRSSQEPSSLQLKRTTDQRPPTWPQITRGEATCRWHSSSHMRTHGVRPLIYQEDLPGWTCHPWATFSTQTSTSHGLVWVVFDWYSFLWRILFSYLLPQPTDPVGLQPWATLVVDMLVRQDRSFSRTDRDQFLKTICCSCRTHIWLYGATVYLTTTALPFGV